MKKLTLSLLAGAISLSAAAEGYQVNLLSAKQSGMGHVGTAMKLGAESMHFNPAGMAFMERTYDFSAGVSGVFAKASYTNGSYKAKTDNDVSTPMYVYAGFKIYDNLSAGLAVTTPYGSGIKWPTDWKGADLVQDISMKSFSFQPTLSWRALDNLSFGAGVMLATGSFDLSRALLTGQNMIDMNIPGIGSEMANLNMVSAKLHGKSNVRVGFNVGVLWDINEQWSLGASYRSRMDMHAKKGTAQLEYINSQVENLIGVLVAAGKFPPIDKGTFEGKLPLPSNLSIGVKYSPTERLLFALDAQMVGWSAYDKLVLQFSEEVLDNYSITAIKDYKNTMIVRLGAQYGLTERLDLRAGVYFDQSPVKEMNYNPETPGMNKIGTSIGASFRPLERLSIDLSLLYIAGLSRDGSYTYKTIVGTETTFSGRYASSAFCPTIGLSFDF